jgi:hypothetical protein
MPVRESAARGLNEEGEHRLYFYNSWRNASTPIRSAKCRCGAVLVGPEETAAHIAEHGLTDGGLEPGVESPGVD